MLEQMLKKSCQQIDFRSRKTRNCLQAVRDRKVPNYDNYCNYRNYRSEIEVSVYFQKSKVAIADCLCLSVTPESQFSKNSRIGCFPILKAQPWHTAEFSRIMRYQNQVMSESDRSYLQIV
jgi:hypothetical protein